VLLGAFDPPTNAHLEILASAADAENRAPVWGMTKVLLDRPPGGLFSFDQRIEIVDAIAHRMDAGFALFEHGTYLEVDRALRAEGFAATFVIGSCKLGQLKDPSFYGYGQDGVDATIAEVSFVVIERDEDSLSATRVRRLVADGEDVSALVPSEVAEVVQGLR